MLLRLVVFCFIAEEIDSLPLFPLLCLLGWAFLLHPVFHCLRPKTQELKLEFLTQLAKTFNFTFHHLDDSVSLLKNPAQIYA